MLGRWQRTIRRRPDRAHRLAVMAVLVSMVLMASCSGPGDDAHTADTPGADAVGVYPISPDTSVSSILFSLETPTSTITDGADAQRLTIASDEVVTWFTDRPARRAGSSSLTEFVGAWAANRFDTDPPNAALVTRTNDPAAGELVTRTHVVELTDPRVEGVTTSFAVVDVPGDPGEAAGHAGLSATHPVEVGSYGPTELFIDSTSHPPCPSPITAGLSTGCLSGAPVIAWAGNDGGSWNIGFCTPDLTSDVRLSGAGSAGFRTVLAPVPCATTFAVHQRGLHDGRRSGRRVRAADGVDHAGETGGVVSAPSSVASARTWAAPGTARPSYPAAVAAGGLIR